MLFFVVFFVFFPFFFFLFGRCINLSLFRKEKLDVAGSALFSAWALKPADVALSPGE